MVSAKGIIRKGGGEKCQEFGVQFYMGGQEGPHSCEHSLDGHKAVSQEWTWEERPKPPEPPVQR